MGSRATRLVRYTIYQLTSLTYLLTHLLTHFLTHYLLAVRRVTAKMREMTGLNLVLIDASGIANFDAKHSLWPTWRRLSQKLTDEVGEHNSGLSIQAADTDEIDEAFERVAGAMASAGASG